MTIENVKCPECEGEMISRVSKYGSFWGCKNFPACKGTRDVMGVSKKERELEKEIQADKEKDYQEGRTTFNRLVDNDKNRFRNE